MQQQGGLWKTAGVSMACLASALMAALPASANNPVELQERAVVLASGADVAGILEKQNPIYPRRAAISASEGWVRLQFDIDTEGQPRNLVVYEAATDSKTHRAIERATVEAVQQWRFTPATIDGQPVARAGFFQVMVFSINNNKSGLSPAFLDPYERASAALENGVPGEALEAIQELEAMELSTLEQYGYLALLHTRYWQAAGDDTMALQYAERARSVLVDSSAEDAYRQALRMTLTLNVAAHNFQTAQERYEELVEQDPGLADDDEVRASALQIQQVLAGREPIVTPGIIAPCALCLDDEYLFTHELNRGRFSISLEEGALEEIRISCQPAHVTLAWEGDVVWNIANDPQDCSVSVYGDPGTRLTLVELADGAPAAANPE